MQENRCRDADVQTLGKAEHRDLNKPVGQGNGFRSESFQLSAEYEGDRFSKRESVGSVVILMRGGGKYTVPAFFQRLNTFRRVVRRAVILMEGQPFGGAQRHIRVHLVFVPVF